ncbi:MAG TPA: MFS transporter [Rhodopila sp.]|uniref:MFS transporter n=1 Tax=Rhodopila sp. TaxID=2480087 RepID=UPI002B7FE595|nr:MFS transporter [Rhodopila sp.]HVY18013.1 MFS transporter [Rhodopila sp.]
MSTVTSVGGHTGSQRRTAVLAGVIGNVLEWYDFAVYGYFVPVISKLFFPNQTPLVSLLLTFSVFGVGFVMRPVGSVVFGLYGDRHGRKQALSAVIFLMAISTFVVGLLPTYDSIGILAPLLLVVARLAQGLSGGGEWGGAAAYLVEYALPDKRGLTGSWQQVSVGTGFLLGSLTAAVLTSLVSSDNMLAWGWRIPFLLGVIVGIVGAILRWRLDDTPKFEELERHGDVARSPLTEAFTTFRKPTLLAFGITLHNTVAYYAVLIYLTTWLTTAIKMPRSTALWSGTICLLAFVIAVPIMGALSDRVGRRPLLIASCAGYAVLTYPMFLLASTGVPVYAFIAQLILVLLLALYAGPGPAVYCELFPTRVRYTALSVGYNIPVAIFGGFAPFIATWLIHTTGNSLAPAFYVIAASLATLVTLAWVKETAFAPLE